MNYDIILIKEFNTGELTLPFLFDLSKVRAFKKHEIVTDEYKYMADSNKKFIRDRVFLYLDYKNLIFEIDEDTLKCYEESVDYILVDEKNYYIKSPNMFFDFVAELNILQKLKNFIDEGEIEVKNLFIKRLTEDLNLNDDKDWTGNNTTHILCSLLGDTSNISIPFFEENIGKSIYDWSIREVELRACYKSKVFMMDRAKQNEISRLEKEAMDKAKKNSR